jgi:hypothetical protein
MRRVVSCLLAGIVTVALLASVRVISRHEQALRDDEVNQQRAMVYELLPGRSLSVPLDADVEAVRVVAHGFSAGALRQSAGSARLRLEVSGPSGSRAESVTLPLTAKEPQASSEDGELHAGDRNTLNVDTSDATPGTLRLTLDDVLGAEGLLVRFYCREALDTAGVRTRHANLGARERERLARRAGQLDWVDLEPEARTALLAVRWAKLAALPDPERALTSHVLTLQKPNARGQDAANQTPAADGEGSAPPASQPESVDFTRATPERPVVVEADESPLVLRLSARIPLQPGSQPEQLLLLVRIEAPRFPPKNQRFEAVVAVAANDRYRPGGVITPANAALPSERALFHVLVPAFGRVTLGPATGVVDLSLSELDPRADPRPTRTPEGATEGARWKGFVARRPSNFGLFPATARGSLRIVPPAPAALAAARSFDASLKRVRVERPKAAITLEHANRLYVAGSSSLNVDVPLAGTVLSLSLFSESDVEVVALIDEGSPRRRTSGYPRFVSTARSSRFRGDATFGIVLGDDLEPGTHHVSLRYDRSVKVWLHVPWSGHSRKPQESAWISGDLEP